MYKKITTFSPKKCLSFHLFIRTYKSYPPDMMEFFCYHLVILLTYPDFWRANILIDHSSAIEKGNHHFTHWLWLTNLFCSEFIYTEPHLWLTFCFRMVMINPGFVNSDDMRRFVPDFPNTLKNNTPFLWSTVNEGSTLNKHTSFQAPLLKCVELTFSKYVSHLPAFERINDNNLQLPLTLCWCWHPSWHYKSIPIKH